MSGKDVTIFSVVAWVLLFSVGLSAHHGVALYDVSQMVNVTGTVTDFQFVNPHVLVFFEVTAENGDSVVWSAGLTSPNRLARSDGLRRDSVKVGDEVTISGAPARSGAPSLWALQVVLNGTPLLGERE